MKGDEDENKRDENYFLSWTMKIQSREIIQETSLEMIRQRTGSFESRSNGVRFQYER